MKKKTLDKLEKVVKKVLTCSVLFLIFLMLNFVTSYVLNYHHEATHEAICLLNEGEIVEKHVSSYDGHVTCSVANDNIIKGFMLTDIIGYHVIGIVKVVEIFVFVILAFVVIRGK